MSSIYTKFERMYQQGRFDIERAIGMLRDRPLLDDFNFAVKLVDRGRDLIQQSYEECSNYLQVSEGTEKAKAIVEIVGEQFKGIEGVLLDLRNYFDYNEIADDLRDAIQEEVHFE